MKKLLSLMLALALVLSLTACILPTDGEIIEPSKVENSEKDDSGENSGNTDDNKQESSAKEVTVQETVLLDENGVKITAKSLNTDSLFGTELKLLIENNSGQDLSFQCRNVSVNGYMVDSMMSVDVVNGKKANDSLTFMSSALKDCGITDIADIELSFHIFTTEDWEDYLNTDQIQIKTSIADTYKYTFDDSGDVAYDADGIKIVIKGLAEDTSILGPSIVVYIENNRENAFTVQCRDISVNGFMVSDLFSCEVMPGKKAIDEISFLDSDLEENEITAIENVELSFHIFDSDSCDDIVDTDVIKIDF